MLCSVPMLDCCFLSLVLIVHTNNLLNLTSINDLVSHKVTLHFLTNQYQLLIYWLGIDQWSNCPNTNASQTPGVYQATCPLWSTQRW